MTWLEDNFEYVDLIDKELTHLENISTTHFEIRNLNVPDNGWEVALWFYNAYTVALSLAIEKANGYDDKPVLKGENVVFLPIIFTLISNRLLEEWKVCSNLQLRWKKNTVS